MTAETDGQRRRRLHNESLARKGVLTVCPLCGAWTSSRSGFCAKCAKREGVKR